MINSSVSDRISPLRLGLGISGSLLLILVVSETLQGRWAQMMTAGEFDVLARVSTGVLRDLRIAIVNCLIAGYLPAAFLYVMQSGRRTVFVLQEALDCTTQECESLAASIQLNRGWLLIIGALAFLLAIATPFLVPPIPETPWSPSSWSAEVAWHRILGPITMIWAWWLGYSIISVSMRMSRIAKRLDKIRLFDLAPLAPFTQQGLSNALLLIGSFSIWSLMLMETGFGTMILLLGSTGLAVSLLAMLAPVQGVHKRIVQSKQEELARLDDEISKLRATLMSSGAGQGGRMADLVAYRGLVDSVAEWPFTSSTFVRLALYTLLPIVTWGVGVVAEAIIGGVFF